MSEGGGSSLVASLSPACNIVTASYTADCGDPACMSSSCALP